MKSANSGFTSAANAAVNCNIGELADDRGVRECLQWFTREKQWINEIHLQLCRVPAPTFLEQERAAKARPLPAVAGL